MTLTVDSVLEFCYPDGKIPLSKVSQYKDIRKAAYQLVRKVNQVNRVNSVKKSKPAKEAEPVKAEPHRAGNLVKRSSPRKHRRAVNGSDIFGLLLDVTVGKDYNQLLTVNPFLEGFKDLEDIDKSYIRQFVTLMSTMPEDGDVPWEGRAALNDAIYQAHKLGATPDQIAEITFKPRVTVLSILKSQGVEI